MMKRVLGFFEKIDLLILRSVSEMCARVSWRHGVLLEALFWFLAGWAIAAIAYHIL